MLKRIARWFATWKKTSDHSTPESQRASVPLEEQLKTLEGLGLHLEAGITIDDLLYSWDRESLEDPPYDLILFLFGSEAEREPWGRRICRTVWNFDTECIEGSGSYVRIVENLGALAGASGRISDLDDEVDLDTDEAWLKYRIDGKQREWKVELNDDWADMMVVSYVMDDLERDGYRFYSKDNGQAAVLVYLDPEGATTLNRLSQNAFTPGLAP